MHAKHCYSNSYTLYTSQHTCLYSMSGSCRINDTPNFCIISWGFGFGYCLWLKICAESDILHDPNAIGQQKHFDLKPMYSRLARHAQKRYHGRNVQECCQLHVVYIVLLLACYEWCAGHEYMQICVCCYRLFVVCLQLHVVSQLVLWPLSVRSQSQGGSVQGQLRDLCLYVQLFSLTSRTGNRGMDRQTDKTTFEL